MEGDGRDGERDGSILPRPLVSSALATIPHGFLTRQGGVSEGAFGSLNCSLSSRDEPARVLRNRRLATSAVALGEVAPLALFQVHGVAVVRAAVAWSDGERPRADAAVTDRPGLALSVVTADCAPVLLADARAGVVGAAHAGWRGAALGILEETVKAMEALGAERGRISAAIGPSIRQASYQVGDDMRDAVLQADDAAAILFRPDTEPGRWRFDLQGLCRSRLVRAGVGTVDDLGLDTCTDEARFFSYRRTTLSGGGPLGHQISVIGLGD